MSRYAKGKLTRYSRYSLLLLLLGLWSLLLGSCHSYLADGIRVAWGKQLFQQGDYQEALLYFLSAEANRSAQLQAQNLNASSERSLGRIHYNVGLVYSALGQTEAAIAKWEPILEQAFLPADEEVHFVLLYNIGLLYSQNAAYTKARLAFVQALRLRPESQEARIALEQILEKIRLENQAEKEMQEEEVLPEPGNRGFSEEQITDYITRKANYHFRKDENAPQPLRNDW